MVLIATRRAALFLIIALMGAPLMMYGSGQIQGTGLAAVVTGLGLLGFDLIATLFGGPRPAATVRATVSPARPARRESVSERWMRNEPTWTDVAAARTRGPAAGGPNPTVGRRRISQIR